MKKSLYLFIALVAAAANLFAQDCETTDINYPGTASITFTRFVHKNLTGVFSVSGSRKVFFSQGNLQYQASTGAWRFAEEQWKSQGATGNNVSGASRETQAAWIDLFPWGVSGWDSDGAGTYAYEPWATAGDWLPHNLTGSYAEADCAWHNRIANGGLDSEGPQEHEWRLLTRDEWDYLLNTRCAMHARERVGFGTLFGKKGLFLLPDEWELSWWSEFVDLEGHTGAYADNVITNDAAGKTKWDALEEHGVVFLPAGGYSGGTYANERGYYASSTQGSYSNNNQMIVNFRADGTFTISYSTSGADNYAISKGWRVSLRPVRNL